MRLGFGDRISGLTADGRELHAAVFNENEVRAAAGLTIMLGAAAFGAAYSGIRGTLPRTICLVCLTLMWIESVLGVCLGCKLHGLLVRRGWTRKDPAFEVCAHGACELPAPSSSTPAST